MNTKYKLLIVSFRNWLQTLGYAEATVYNMPHAVRDFLQHMEQQNEFVPVSELRAAHVVEYLAYVKTRPNKRRTGALSSSYINKQVQALQKLMDYLRQTGKSNLHVTLEYEPILNKEIDVLTKAEIANLYEACENTPLGIRDRLVLSLCYGCGLRKSEAVGLELEHYNAKNGTLYIAQTKNRKSRYVPVGRQVQKDIANYLNNSREILKAFGNSNHLLLNYEGRPLSKAMVYLSIKGLGKRAEIKREVTPHKLRHSIATHLLSKGMKLEHIQVFLGHSSLESTEIYTHLV